jgi:hypothetical protein
MKIKALAQTIGHKMVKGDSSTDPKEFDGFQKRAVGLQLVDAGATSGGDALSLAKLDEAIDRTDSPTHLLMSKAVRSLLNTASKSTTLAGFITFDKDDFGRRIAMYNDLPILIADGNADLFATLGFDEANPGGGSSVGTSIYVLSLNESGVIGIQSGEMQVTDLGELEGKPVFRTRVEWYVAQSMRGPRSITRLRGIKAAPVVA